MESDAKEQLKPGAKVRVTQQIPARDHTITTDVSGTVVRFEQKPTGSWYAHSKDDKLWLDRLTLRKEDGEITTLSLDDYTVVNAQEPAAPADESPSAPKD